MLGQSDVTEARMINQALVESSPGDGVMGFGCGHSFIECLETDLKAKRTRFQPRLRD